MLILVPVHGVLRAATPGDWSFENEDAIGKLCTAVNHLHLIHYLFQASPQSFPIVLSTCLRHANTHTHTHFCLIQDLVSKDFFVLLMNTAKKPQTRKEAKISACQPSQISVSG